MTAYALTADDVARGSARRLALLPLVAFAAAAAGAGLARAVTTTYLPLLLNEIQDAPGLIGTVMLVNAIAGFVVPLVVGVWSDRVEGPRRRSAFIVGGSLVGAGGLVATAAGASSSYLVLTAAGAVVYVGLNAVTTVHRALVPERFGASERPRATSAQELALLGGGLAGIAVGGALTEIALWAPFLVAAALLPLLALPTLASARGAGRAERESAAARSRGYYLAAARRPGVGAFLTAQVLWVLGYAALPAFFLLYAEEELGLRPAAASLWLAAFGIATAAAIVAGGRVRRPSLQRPLLLAGVVLMGAGFLGVAASNELLSVAPALLAGAAGFGLISTLGFPLFSALIPDGEEGGYSALYFSVRAIASTIALPAAGWLVAATGSYRMLFVLGGGATLAALLPLGVAVRRPRRRGRTAAALLALVPTLGLLVAHTPVRELDAAMFRAVNGFFEAPELLWRVLDPHTRNYVVLVVAALGAAAVTSPRRIPRVATHVLGAAIVAWALLEAIYAVYNRARPEEVLAAHEIVLEGHSWAHLNSFPSGHMAITAALATGVALAFPRSRYLLAGYVLAVAFTRVLFGAHFPLDTVAGTALGIASALLVALALDRGRRRTTPTGGDREALAPADVVAVMPSYEDVPAPALLAGVSEHVGAVVVVDDGSSPEVARQLDEAAATVGATLVRLPARTGKGSAVRAGIQRALEAHPRLGAVMVVDADGQHPPGAIPRFLDGAASADLVVGDRFADLASMPLVRRLANRTTRRLFALASGHSVRDTQNGMRLLRRDALELFPGGGYEAETTHLRRVLRAGLGVSWVSMPAIYGAERSSFRAGRDSARVLWALVRPLDPPFPRLRRSLLASGLVAARPARGPLGTREAVA